MAGIPPRMRGRYAIIESLHLLARHEGHWQNCRRCHERGSRIVAEYLRDEKARLDAEIERWEGEGGR